MFLSRSEKEWIVVAIVTVFLLIGLFFGGRLVLQSLRDRSDPPSSTLSPPEPTAPPLDRPPVVTFVDGYADGRRGNADQWEDLYAGSELDSRSVVRTHDDSYLDIRLQGGNVVRVMEETLFSLAELTTERIAMDVREGELVSRLERIAGTQEFSIRTPDAVAGVRGTELVLSVEPDETVVFGMSGSVEVSSPEHPGEVTRLGVHEKTSINEGMPPSSAEPMTDAEINRYRQLLNSLNEEEVLIVSTRITFEPDSAELTPDARAAVQEIYEQLREIERDVEIVGHTANVGSPQSQLILSRERAEAVRSYLVELGIPGAQLTATGVGGTRPITESTESDAIQRNRRVEFRATD